MINRQFRDIFLAFVISALIHAGFFFFSQHIQFGGYGLLVDEIEKTFEVQIRREEDPYVRRQRRDIEADNRAIRETIPDRQKEVPDIQLPPPMDAREEIDQRVNESFENKVAEKSREDRIDATLPDLINNPLAPQRNVAMLETTRQIGREQPSVERSKIDEGAGEGSLPSGMTGAIGSMDSAVPAAVASAPMGAPVKRPPIPALKELLPPPPPEIAQAPELDISPLPTIPPIWIEMDTNTAEEIIPIDPFLSVQVFVYHEPGNPRGYFAVRVRPNERSGELPVMNKDVIFVLDASASMGNRTLRALREGIKSCLRGLRSEDMFNVLGFKRTVSQAWESFQYAEEPYLSEAADFIDELQPWGRTDIYSSLEPISRMARGGDHPFMIFICSDGRPNVGVVDSRAIINRLSANVRENTSIFAFGTGTPLNPYLLDMLAYRNKGFAEFSTEFTMTPIKVEEMFDSISDPLLINLRTDYGQISEEEIYPKQLPDLFRGRDLWVFGRYEEEERFTLRIRGEAKGQKKDFVIEIPFPEKDNGTEDLARQWAYRKIYFLIAQMSKFGESEERLNEIESLSRRYGVSTPYYDYE